MRPIELSVVVTGGNGRVSLERCLLALCSQTQPSDTFEVIVGNADSTDDTAAMLARLGAPYRLRTLNLGQVGRGAARNAALEVAEGGACLILDDDIVASEELVAQHVAAHRLEPLLLGIGSVIDKSRRRGDWYTRHWALAQSDDRRRLKDSPAHWTDCCTGNFSVSRQAVQGAGGFDATLDSGEDIELAYRLWQGGCPTIFLPHAEATRHDHRTRRNLLADSRRRGRASVRIARLHPRTMPRLIGWFGSTSHRQLALTRLVLALRVPPGMLARLGPLIPGKRRQMLWFEFLRRLAFWRGARPGMSRSDWARLTRGVPTLVYHAFSDSPEANRYVIDKRLFASQMRVLAALRYRVIRFEDLAACQRECRLPPRRSVVITMDDGYSDNAAIALPILGRHRFPVTIFLVSQRLGGRSDWASDASFNDRKLLGAKEIERLQSDVVRFGAHTRTHCSLPDTPDERVGDEVQGSRLELESALGFTISTFAYPFGRYDERSVQAVESAGFIGAGTTEPRLVRPNDAPALMPRIEIMSSDSVARFVRKLWFGS